MRVLPSVLTVATAAVLTVAAPAWAHVEPQTAEVPAGATTTVDFTVQHGCDGSPTVMVEIQVPEEITAAAPAGKPGWTGNFDMDGVITYSGGSLPADREDTFGVTFTAPTTVGAELRFPMIQTCEEGSIDWIQTGEEAERPAPVVKVVEPDPDATTTTAAAPSSTSEAAPSSTTTAPPTTTAGPLTTDEGSTDEGSDDEASPVPWVAGGALLVAGIGVGFWLSRRRAAGPDQDA